ncbi:MAG TPA: hypothetical protein PK511_02510 [Chitinophagales bacterium]|nr:hypothetical protein [Chitinophagales bacterium]HMU69077.1 hypothetical protein [Chitinophagales bacterium]HMZ88954.1 hypothetical protein [Chitinophagales bacterium]HNA56543.1 hypothetical protein [Chitinophagales bacterium]HNE45102.1 hypothetical protein [Chitinophagales bacterium]
MSRLNISGSVSYLDTTPAKNATVRIIDQDDRSSDNVILTATTDSRGKFVGRTIDWKDEPDGFWPWEHDFMNLTFEVTDSIGRRHTGPFIYVNAAISVPILLPFTKPAIRSENRALLVLADLSQVLTGTLKNFRPLYQFSESNGVNLVNANLRGYYHEIKVLGPGDVTLDRIVSNLSRMTGNSNIWEVDLIVFLHGGRDSLTLSNDTVHMTTIVNAIRDANLPASKLRMVYSTACYGASQADNWVSAGFNCASGSKACNANGAVELLPFLLKWREGKTFGTCISESENLVLSAPFDAAARLMLPDQVVNSDKDVIGDGTITISSF